MGQMTFAVMYGSDRTPPESLDEGWYSLIEQYRPGRGLAPDRPHGDGQPEIVGFWVAVGASGKKGVPDLDTNFLLDGYPGLAAVAKYRQAHARAFRAWERFAKWAKKKHGIDFGLPHLWLVQTEVA